MRRRAAGLQGQSVQGLRGGRPGRLNGGSLAASAGRRPLGDPLRDQRLVGTGHLAQFGNGLASRLIFRALILGRAEREPGDLSQQIATVPGDLPQLCCCGGFLGFGQAAPPGTAEGNAGQPGAEQPAAAGPGMIATHLARIEHAYGKSKLAILVSAHSPCGKEPGILTPASPDSLPPLGALIADEPFWRYPTSTAREGVAHLRVWLTAGREPGHLAVVTQTGSAASVTDSAGQIWAELARQYGPSLALLEHHPVPEAGEGAEALDLVRIGTDGSPHWLRVWPTAAENPRHAGLELWMAVHGHRIVDKPATWFDSCED